MVVEGEAELRLDRWFRINFPDLGHARLQKLLRTGQVRVDGKRVKAGARLWAGAQVRIPPLGDPPSRPAQRRGDVPVTDEEAEFVRSLVLFRDEAVIALNKPPGLAVQGGTGTHRHLARLLGALRFEAGETPRLVHRLDKDTSGVLLLGRTRAATAALGKAFRDRTARKIYWAVTVGVPERSRARIDLALAKLPGPAGEKMAVDKEAGQRALTWYRVIDTAGRRLSWLALWPRTGRTHQLRVHCLAMGCPILGDGKYGGADAFVTGHPVSRKLHLHAREVALPHPAGSGELSVRAPLPEHMAKTWELFGFEAEYSEDPFDETF